MIDTLPSVSLRELLNIVKVAILHPVLAWKIPWTEEPGGLQSMGSH